MLTVVIVVQLVKGTMNSNKTDNIEIELESIRLHENKTSVSSLPKDNGLEVCILFFVCWTYV